MPIKLPLNEVDRQENEHIYGFDISPDHTKLLYYHSIGSQTAIVIVTADGNPIWSQSMGSGEAWKWFDNKRLYDWTVENDGIPIMTLWNYVTGDKQFIEANYYGYTDTYTGVFFFWWINPYAKFDSLLTKVVYPACDPDCSEGYPIILRDIGTEQIMTRLITKDMFGLEPIWTPDNSQIILAANLSSSTVEALANEIYLISKEGELRQLTHFTDYYDIVEIHPYYSLSSNGRFLAFWMKVQPGLFDDDRLAVLDIETGTVINYCLPGETFRNNLALENKGYPSDYGDPPVWSPDSTQLMVVGRDPEQRSIRWNILVDMELEVAIKVGEDLEDVGWMISP